MKRKLNKGFSLIELIVAIAVMLILAGIFIPVIRGAMTSARSAECVSNLRQIGVCFNLYVTDNNGRCPPLITEDRKRTWRSLLAEQYMSSDSVSSLEGVSSDPYELFWCPEYNVRYEHQDHVAGRGSYSLNWFFDNNSTGKERYASSLIGAIEPLVIDGWPRSDLSGVGGAFGGFRTLQTGRDEGSGNYHSGESFNALYLDGHVGNLTPADASEADDAVRVRNSFD